MKRFRVSEEGKYFGSKIIEAETKEEAIDRYECDPCEYGEYTYTTDDLFVEEVE